LVDRRDDSKISISVKRANVGDEVKLNCNLILSDIKGVPQITWTFNNSHLLLASYFQGYRSILLKKVQFKNAGSYSCYGTAVNNNNELQHFAATIKLTVYGMLDAVRIICNYRKT